MTWESNEERRAYYRAYNKNWYQRHKKRLLEKRREHNTELRLWLRQYKSKFCCANCGESHPACLQFHHRDRAEKSFNIGGLARRPTSKVRLLKEMEKCDVLCVNCHAKLHWRETHSTDNWEEVVPPER